MSKSVKISSESLLSIIESVLTENKTFLKLGNGGAEQAAPPMAPNAGMQPMQDPSLGMGPEMAPAVPAGGPTDPSASEMGAGGEENQFDTNFDAGVEADEDSDPKTYIQQLTGKLSQSLNSYNDEQGQDAGLNKYVASMIVTAACKNLDDKAKEEIIKKIKSANSGADEDMPDNGELENGDMGDGEGLQECMFTKKQISEMTNGFGIRPNDRQDNLPTKDTEPVKSIFRGKTFSN